MKLIFYSPQTLPSIGGLQYAVHYWAEALTGFGHEVTVITETPARLNAQSDSPAKEIRQIQTAFNSETSTGAPLPPLGDEGKGLPAGSAEVRGATYTILRNPSFGKQLRIMRAADRIIMFNVSLKGLPAVQLSGAPLYISHHTALWYPNGPRPLRQRMKQWVANNIAKGNCACSGYIAGFYQNCRVIHSPFRADLFFRGFEPRRPGSVVFAGRLVSDKGVDLLIEAFARLVYSAGETQTGSPPPGELQGASLTIIGDGPERKKLEQLAEKLGLVVVQAMSCSDATSLPLEAGYVAGNTQTGSPLKGESEGPSPNPNNPSTHQPVNQLTNEELRDVAENKVHTMSCSDATSLPLGERDVAGNTQTGSPLKGESEGPSPNPNNPSTITFTGPLSQPALVRQLQTHELMVVPSRMEPMGMVVAEGLACGCRMVVSNQGGLPEVGGAFCRYFESGDVDSLAEALRRELTRPLPVEADSLQKHLEKFTIEYAARQLEDWLTG